MGKIDRRKYPELNYLLWDIHNKLIEPKVAFEMYEKRWKYVNTHRLTRPEQRLVQRLTNVYGKGIFMAA